AVAAAVAAGALGARMTGGGFGGSVIALVPAAAAGSVARTVTDAFAAAGFAAPAVLEALPSPGARRIG
ncbi:galactokinase, partial [Streptomyces yangpuensis]